MAQTVATKSRVVEYCSAIRIVLTYPLPSVTKESYNLLVLQLKRFIGFCRFLMSTSLHRSLSIEIVRLRVTNRQVINDYLTYLTFIGP